MVQERRRQFLQAYGFASDSLDSENFLTFRRLEELEQAACVNWEFTRPDYGLRWKLRPSIARLRGRREPAAFMLLCAVKPEA